MRNSLTHKNWILLVDDDADARLLIKDDIKKVFHEKVNIIEAKDGVEATSKLGAQAFDLIITDLQMPNRSGQSFIDWVKKSVMNENTPIIVTTGFPDTDLMNKFSEIVCLEKPYNQGELTKAIEQQFKLGRLNERVGAEVINIVLDVCTEFVQQVMDSKATVEKPMPKKSGQDLEGDIVCCIRIKTKAGSCRLGLGFNNDLLEHMVKVLNKKYELPREKIVDVALKVIFKLTSNAFYKRTGERPSLQERIVFSDHEHQFYKQVSAARGLIIPVQSDAGCLYAHALYLNGKQKYTKAS